MLKKNDRVYMYVVTDSENDTAMIWHGPGTVRGYVGLDTDINDVGDCNDGDVVIWADSEMEDFPEGRACTPRPEQGPHVYEHNAHGYYSTMIIVPWEERPTVNGVIEQGLADAVAIGEGEDEEEEQYLEDVEEEEQRHFEAIGDGWFCKACQSDVGMTYSRDRKQAICEMCGSVAERS